MTEYIAAITDEEKRKTLELLLAKFKKFVDMGDIPYEELAPLISLLSSYKSAVEHERRIAEIEEKYKENIEVITKLIMESQKLSEEEARKKAIEILMKDILKKPAERKGPPREEAFKPKPCTIWVDEEEHPFESHTKAAKWLWEQFPELKESGVVIVTDTGGLIPKHPAEWIKKAVGYLKSLGYNIRAEVIKAGKEITVEEEIE